MIKAYFLFGIVVLFNAFLIKLLRQLKVYQSIYELSPEHHREKSFTPSFGGLSFLIGTVLGVIIFHLFDPRVFWCLSLMTVFTAIGFFDDILSFMKEKNKGLSVAQKFMLQSAAALFFLVVFHFLIRPLSLWDFFIYWFVIVGASNATNLTDGLDGLLAGLSLVTLTGFAFVFRYFELPVMISFLIVLIISVSGFLLFNRYPAKMFMGDTGSLALGALFAALTVVLDNPWLLLPFGAVYIMETLSVIIQVAYFKRKRKRVFLMSPLHHHFEMMGLSETMTVFLFWFIGFLFALLYFVFLNI